MFYFFLWIGDQTSMFIQARWYLKAAEGGSTRAMYNTALCYLSGEGITRNYQEARKWMKRAALAGHTKAQFEHGLKLFAVCVFLAHIPLLQTSFHIELFSYISLCRKCFALAL
jgi:TPR repeat protein